VVYLPAAIAKADIVFNVYVFVYFPAESAKSH